MRKNFSYDKLGDSLIVSNRQEGDIIENNHEIGDMIFSMTREGKIASLEIREISSLFESCDVNPEIVNQIKDAKISIIDRSDTVILILQIQFSENNLILTKNIPIVLPLFDQIHDL
ncbi:hypothetical protein CMI42_06575 [Candidatus Pacearchaeota archaeon]|nr:hypothetical protein [Candidatus Pacearchaeota archaeon]|tara:strand:- start:516 stop:863 length:348 start_codon:yes stop_codon:yes gene_type:complete